MTDLPATVDHPQQCRNRVSVLGGPLTWHDLHWAVVENWGEGPYPTIQIMGNRKTLRIARTEKAHVPSVYPWRKFVKFVIVPEMKDGYLVVAANPSEYDEGKYAIVHDFSMDPSIYAEAI